VLVGANNDGWQTGAASEHRDQSPQKTGLAARPQAHNRFSQFGLVHPIEMMLQFSRRLADKLSVE